MFVLLKHLCFVDVVVVEVLVVVDGLEIDVVEVVDRDVETMPNRDSGPGSTPRTRNTKLFQIIHKTGLLRK